MPCIHLLRQLWEGCGWHEKTPQPVIHIVGFIKPKGTVSNRLNFVDKLNMMHDFKCCSSLNTPGALCLFLLSICMYGGLCKAECSAQSESLSCWPCP